VSTRGERLALFFGWMLLVGAVAVTLSSQPWKSCAGDPRPTSENVVLGLLGGAVFAVLAGGVISAAQEYDSRKSIVASALLWLLTIAGIVGTVWLAVRHTYDPCIGG